MRTISEHEEDRFDLNQIKNRLDQLAANASARNLIVIETLDVIVETLNEIARKVDWLESRHEEVDSTQPLTVSNYPEPPDPREFIDEDTGRINTVLYTATLVAWERVVMEIVKSQQREPIRLDEDDLDW